MLQDTVRRTASGFSDPIIIAGEAYQFLIQDQLNGVGIVPSAIILEPEPRNTAPAVALAAFHLLSTDPDAIMLVMPSDHVIEDVAAFTQATMVALACAQAGRLVTFGVPATSAATGYGYIEAGQVLNQNGVRDVLRFVEKPDATTAQRFCDSGRYYWNAGIFLFSAAAFVNELTRFAPEIRAASELAMAEAQRCGPLVRPAADAFMSSPSISIDYAVMERTTRASMVPINVGWSDVGSWDALWEISSKDDDGNAIRGDVVAVDTSNSLIRSDGDTTVAAVGVDDLVIVATADAVLVVPRNRAQDTKMLADRLRDCGNDKHSTHPEVHAHWGSYQVLDKGNRSLVKRLTVSSGKTIAIEVEDQRSEHWIVIEGTARVTIGDVSRIIRENQSAYIPAGGTHRVENAGKAPLRLIQVQCGGTHFGEDNISLDHN